jgi:uncharacterized membrane protein (DUF106 family)
MNIIDSIIMQLPSLRPQYTKHPLFPDMLTAIIAAPLIAIGMNIAFSLLRKKTTDIEKMNKVMKETTNEWRKQYTDAIKKQDKERVTELKKKQAYVNKIALEIQHQQVRPMLIYVAHSFMLSIFVFPAIFGQTVSLSLIEIPWIMCSEQNLKTDTKLDEKGEAKGACSIRGEVYLWGWFLMTSFAFSGIISKATQTAMPSLD